MTFGNLMLYIGFILVASFVILIEASIKKPKKYSFEKLRQLSKMNALIFLSLLSYLVYLFLLPDFTTNVVWKYTEKSAPFMFKISGLWAGQEGTYFLWAGCSVIFIYLLLISNQKNKSNSKLFLRTLQVSALSSLFLIAMVIFSSPFDSIYDIDPDLPSFYVPQDGNSLNPALLNTLMVIHPPIIFIAYALLIIPFSASFCILFKTRKNDISEWVGMVRPWLRSSWLFLTLSLSLGGLWAYMILGWGGFWAWDPVETSSLVPWFIITAVLHLLYRMNNREKRFTILAPALTIVSFILVLYSTFITRSSLWGSIHSFESVALSVSVKIILTFISLSIILLLILIYKKITDKKVIKSLKKSIDSEIKLDIDTSFYIMSALLVLLTIISLFGLTYPFLYELFSPQKLATSIEFYNLWSYVFLVPLILFTGYGMSLSTVGKNKEIIFKIVVILTIVFAFIRPGNNLTLLDTSGLFYMTASPVYKIIGNLSLLSIAPPLIYLLFTVVLRMKNQLKRQLNLKRKTKNHTMQFAQKMSVSIIHLAVFLIIFSLMFASFTTYFDTNLKKEQGSISKTPIFSNLFGTENYSIVLIDYKKEMSIDKKEYPKYAEIADIIFNPYDHTNAVTIYGLVTEVKHVSSYSYIKITDNNQYLWTATTKGDYRPGDYLVAHGSLFYDFKSPTTGTVYDFILFSDNVKITETDLKTYQEHIVLDIYKDGKKITDQSIINTHNKYGSEVKVAVDRHILYDVYITFNGSSDEELYFSVKILPFVNLMWLGILLFALSMTVIIFTKEPKLTSIVKLKSKSLKSTSRR